MTASLSSSLVRLDNMESVRPVCVVEGTGSMTSVE